MVAQWTYLVFFILFEVGSLICGLANSSPMLIAGRAIAGLGSSGLLNGGMTIIAGAIPLEKRPLIQLGTVFGPLVGGVLTEYASWRWCFYINLPVGGVAGILLLWIKIPDLTVKPPFTLALMRETIPKLDLLGFALFTPASTMFLLALQFGGNDFPWNSSVVIGLFCGAGVAAILFVCWEKRVGDEAMIPFSVAGQRIVYCSALNGAALVVAILVAAQYLPIYFQGVLGYEPAMSGVNLLPTIISQLLMVILSGVLIQKVGYYLPFAIAGSAVSAVGNGLVSMFSPLTKTATWIGYQIVLGTGRGIGMQTGVVAVQNALPAHQIPIGIAFTIFCQNFAGAIFVVVGNVVFSQALTSEIRAHAPSVSLDAAFAAGARPSAIRALVPPGSPEIGGVLLAFSNSINKVFYMLVACCGGGLLVSLGMGWVDTRKKKTAEAA
ncbi:putative HC-toxin efflux carrier TOXA 19 [Colletotrichum chlorophyti]|uniref:Putative HC-toxin efflux carrier TOXA 19 n=1 Tax=Colletotrichum chlorophyti TaxID=708187 RepID=A0A1Q8RZQ5_9PEZI|nr:putative HC-toxin efflux carrier TOXA 19 [Colletotrichum chlorophyti]